MDFRTSVELPTDLPAISHSDRVLMLGSCFAENIGKMLGDGKFLLDLNPFGILYNPLSISTAVQEILTGKVYTENELFYYKDSWHSPMHHGSFSASTTEETLQNINSRLQKTQRTFSELSWLVITFGTAYVYERKSDGQVVSNCHKQPESTFNRRLLSVEEIENEYTVLFENLRETCPGIKILFTVSPIRHVRDGMHANQLSKSTLLLAIARLQEKFADCVFYFPAYELMLDELRDYRFYADDMLHPSPLAIRYLWERFSNVFFTKETDHILNEIEEIRRDLAHKPFHPESEAYQRFLEQIVLKIERLNGKYPYLDFQKERELCHIRLNP